MTPSRLLCLLGLVGATLAAQAQTALKVGGLRTISLLPVMYAEKQGYFKREGLDVEVTTVNAGPAVVSAVMSNSVQIGYAASLPVLFARAQNQPVRIFSAFTYETQKPDGQWTWLVASERSGVKTMKDLAGKTVALNASGALCELQFREHLAKAGVAWDAVKKIVVPYPQMQAALQLGNADAGCVIEPFRTNVRVAPAVKAIPLATGTLPGVPSYALDVLFVNETWGNANKDVLRRFQKGMATAMSDFASKPGLYRQLIADDFKLSPVVVSLMKSDLEWSMRAPAATDVQPLIDAMARHKMLTAPLKGADLILPL